MRIALFGGSFNPVHLGHIKLVNDVRSEFNIDKVIIMPTYYTPMKDNSEFANSEHRFEMCKLAFEAMDSVEVSDMEIKRQGNSYTYLTLNSLKEIYPYDDLFMIVGADMFLTLQNWKNPQEIFKSASVIAVPRECESDELYNHGQRLKQMGCNSYIMSHKVMDVSSTQIREKLNNNENVDEFLDTKVFEYIKKCHLYGT
ncbi:MAG: nicotinate (nicotinamide) nucleotide adenylyltransferase [Ruminococcus sp.]|nr:nicotinate (nicotinamide) nucleotide adenylyltransferase [Ruminococcus sp.]